MMTVAETFDENWKFNESTGCWEWTRALLEGYGQLWVDGKHTLAHRYAWERENGPAGKLWVLHKCDNRRCVNPHHMFLGTKVDNAIDMNAKGREARGAKHGHAKLTEQDVRDIRAAVVSRTARQCDLADRYGVTRSVISTIISREAWTHVE